MDRLKSPRRTSISAMIRGLVGTVRRVVSHWTTTRELVVDFVHETARRYGSRALWKDSYGKMRFQAPPPFVSSRDSITCFKHGRRTQCTMPPGCRWQTQQGNHDLLDCCCDQRCVDMSADQAMVPSVHDWSDAETSLRAKVLTTHVQDVSASRIQMISHAHC